MNKKYKSIYQEYNSDGTSILSKCIVEWCDLETCHKLTVKYIKDNNLNLSWHGVLDCEKAYNLGSGQYIKPGLLPGQFAPIQILVVWGYDD